LSPEQVRLQSIIEGQKIEEEEEEVTARQPHSRSHSIFDFFRSKRDEQAPPISKEHGTKEKMEALAPLADTDGKSPSSLVANNSTATVVVIDADIGYQSA
jgi:hypothetical protein